MNLRVSENSSGGKSAAWVPTKGRASDRGFTLIELMVVVVIISILATLAIFGVRSYVNYSKVSEARQIVGAIMAAQEAFYDETSAYLDVTGGVSDSDFYPEKSDFDGTSAVQWGAENGCMGVDFSGDPATCLQNFDTLGVLVNKPVVFRYASTVFAPGEPPPLHSSISGLTDRPNANRPGFVVIALSNMDGAGSSTRMSAVVGTNMQSDLYTEDEGD